MQIDIDEKTPHAYNVIGLHKEKIMSDTKEEVTVEEIAQFIKLMDDKGKKDKVEAKIQETKEEKTSAEDRVYEKHKR